MRAGRIRGHIKEKVRKWAEQEKRSRKGNLRAKPELLLSFLPTQRDKPRLSADISLYRKPKGESPKKDYVQTVNSMGELIVAIETVLGEWKALSGYA